MHIISKIISNFLVILKIKDKNVQNKYLYSMECFTFGPTLQIFVINVCLNPLFAI